MEQINFDEENYLARLLFFDETYNNDEMARKYSLINYIYFDSFYVYKDYQMFVLELNKYRLTLDSYSEKRKLLPLYIRTFELRNRQVWDLLRKIEFGEIEIDLFVGKTVDFSTAMILDGKLKDGYENVNEVVVYYLRRLAEYYHHELTLTLKHPQFVLNDHEIVSRQLGTFRNHGAITYKKLICYSHNGFLKVYSHVNIRTDELSELYSVLMYLTGSPIAEFMDNEEHDTKIEQLYSNVDLLHHIVIHKTKFFTEERTRLIFALRSFLNHNESDVYAHTHIEELNHAEMFSLYQTALKQVEPLPKVVFLYRIIEYAYHHKINYSENKLKIIPYIDNCLSNAINNSEYVPIMVKGTNSMVLTKWSDYGSERIVIGNHKDKEVINLIEMYRESALEIINQWKISESLNGFTPGHIIYTYGRNGIAHGGNRVEHPNINIGRVEDYIFSNEVVICLELISRYLIESVNPFLADLISRDEKDYTELD